MASDGIVSPKHVLHAVMELQRRGSTPVLSDLEKLEPDLMEYLLEGLTQLHHALARSGLSAKQLRRLYRHAESLSLVCIMALRGAHRELWQGAEPDPDPPSDASPEL